MRSHKELNVPSVVYDVVEDFREVPFSAVHQMEYTSWLRPDLFICCQEFCKVRRPFLEGWIVVGCEHVQTLSVIFQEDVMSGPSTQTVTVSSDFPEKRYLILRAWDVVSLRKIWVHHS